MKMKNSFKLILGLASAPCCDFPGEASHMGGEVMISVEATQKVN